MKHHLHTGFGMLVPFILTLFISIPAQAADKKAESVRTIYIVEVQPAHNRAFTDGVKEWIICRKKNGATLGFNAYESLTGVLGQYAFTGEYGSWGDLDRQDPSSKPCSALFMSKVSPNMERVRAVLTRVDGPASYWKNTKHEYKMFSVTDYWVKPGMYKTWENVVIQVAKAARKADYKTFWLAEDVVSGGRDAPHVTFISPYDSWADMGSDRDEDFRAMLVKTLGKAKTAKLYRQFRKAMSKRANRIWVRNEKLSLVVK